MISDILDAELVVADITDLNPNVFYELGIRHSTLKPTIHVARAGTQLPFDTVTHRTIFIDLTEWQSTERGRAQLAASARAASNSQFQVSNPLTQANANAKMRESADPQERLLGGLSERVSYLEARLQDLAQPQVRDGREWERADIRRERHFRIHTLVSAVVENAVKEKQNNQVIQMLIREALENNFPNSVLATQVQDLDENSLQISLTVDGDPQQFKFFKELL
jgi:hypothetical protein